MILFSKDIPVKIIDKKVSNDGRYILLDCTLWDTQFVFCCVYAPTKDKQNEQLQFLNCLTTMLVEYEGSNIILGGDFNAYLNPSIDKKGGFMVNNSKYTDSLKNLLCELDLVLANQT